MIRNLNKSLKSPNNIIRVVRNQSTIPAVRNTVSVCNQNYPTDSWTNVTPKILSYQGRNIYLKKDHETEHELKTVLVGLAQHLFGKDIEYRWVDSYFPFTQPSWELEVYWNGEWLELLGSGIMRNEILETSGISDTIGWEFGVGLERLAMVLYEIPDIRLFWSNDSGFLNQFKEKDFGKRIKFQPVSIYPHCANDISFWLPANTIIEDFAENDLYDLVRDVGGDIIEQVSRIDKFVHPKSGKSSLCFRIVYRHMERTLSQAEVNEIHSKISSAVEKSFNVEIR